MCRTRVRRAPWRTRSTSHCCFATDDPDRSDARDIVGTISDPEVWEFKRRQGVTFHDGAAFNVDDVVSSFQRAMHPDSSMKELLVSIADVRRVDDHTVHVGTTGPNPLLPNNLNNLFVMDAGWAKTHGVEKPQDFNGGEETHAERNANGSGAFRLVSRQPDAKTVLRRNDRYWGKGKFPLWSAIWISSRTCPCRICAGVSRASGLKVASASQNRTIFFGLNLGDGDLENDNVSGWNPFADRRVRKAMNVALDREAIGKVVMRGQSDPTGVILSPFVNGSTPELHAYP